MGLGLESLDCRFELTARANRHRKQGILVLIRKDLVILSAALPSYAPSARRAYCGPSYALPFHQIPPSSYPLRPDDAPRDTRLLLRASYPRRLSRRILC